MLKSRRHMQWIALAPLALSACLAAAAAAGAGGAVYVTSRGAEAVVEGQPASLEPRIRSALDEYKVAISGSSTDKGGDQLGWKGMTGDIEVNVTAERQSETTTKIEVTARRSVAEWDKELAERILQRIVGG